MSNKTKKKGQLGMDPGTASAILKKMLMFQMAKELERNYCYQCGAEIETVSEFSVEHKIPWLDSDAPQELFFDLNNIAFSHLNCNIRAARQTRGQNCGTVAGYKRGCRCKDCSQAMRDSWNKYDRKKKKVH